MKCEKLEVVEIYKAFVNSRDFGFKDQITRSSLSIGSCNPAGTRTNIAEGMEKESNKEKIRFIEIAKGSTAELITQVYIGIEIDYIEKELGIKWTK